MRSVITHFYNEEYLLPWWLKHHVNIFDHGVLINHRSTDLSAEICRELAPHWRLVDSKLDCFDAYLTDFEVMQYEFELQGSKIALTTTEFFMPSVSLAELDWRLSRHNRQAMTLTGVIMVDAFPDRAPTHDFPLVAQKHHGYFEQDHPELGNGAGYGRIYHCAPVGQYTTGRHASQLYCSDWRQDDAFIFKYAYSPWTPEMKARKLQIASQIPQTDVIREMGHQHLRRLSEMEEKFQIDLAATRNLAEHSKIASAMWRLGSMPR